MGRGIAEIARTGGRCIAVRVDVTKAEEVEHLVEAVLSRWGRLDVAVNNAGICRNSPAEQTARAEWDAVIALDLTAVFLCCQAAGRRMIAQGSGSIVNIASMSARGVRVNCISPGYVDTDMLKPVPQMHPAWLERTPLRRFAEPWEVGGLAVYFASDASAFCTGSDFLIDGGYTLW